jgi:hypothetical protein
MGLGSAAAAPAKSLPQFFHKRKTDTEAFRNGGLRGVSSFKSMNNAISEVLRVGFHMAHCALKKPDMQMQTALDEHPR